MAMWQPNLKDAVASLRHHRQTCISDLSPCENEVRAVLKTSGALSEINRLTALLAMKNETIKTLRERVLQDTATSEDDYDSGYRAA